jgi:spore coat protein U-like protein
VRVGRVVATVAALLGAAIGVATAQECDVSASFVDFGSLDLRRGGEITGRVSVTCDRPQPIDITASAGYGSYGLRRMRGPGGTKLRYNLYLDPGHRLVWGDGSASTARLTGETSGREASFIVYALVPGGQSAPPGGSAGALTIALHC